MKDQLIHIDLEVEGMTCANCALGITRFLEQKGLKEVFVNFATNEVRFATDTDTVQMKDVIQGIEGLGYTVIQSDIQKTSGRDKTERKLIFSALFTIPLLLAMFLPFPLLHNPYFQLAICLPVYILGFLHFGKSALSSLKTGVPNMDVLIFIGSTAAFVYSLTGTLLQLGHDYQFYETAATIITLVLLGNVIEHRSVQRTTTAIRELQQLQPEKARRIFFDLMGDGKTTEEVLVSELQKNDLVQVNDGDKIPLDGIIKEGTAEIDESMITGESIPVVKSLRDTVIGGTIVTGGQLTIEVTHTHSNGFLQNIIQLVKDAQMKKPSVQRLADKIAAWFVPAVVSIALLTFLLSWLAFDITLGHSILRAIAVLVIACPCAMGLATPTAVMVGLGRSVKKGILIKGAVTMEELARTEVLVFDKTGTLTDGKFQIRKTDVAPGYESVLPALVASLEQYSSHPLAQSLVAYFNGISEETVNITDVKETKGVGISGNWEGRKVMMGNKSIVADTDLQPADVYVTVDGAWVGSVWLSDTIKPEAADAISYFRRQGITTILLSGDTEEKCRSVAERLRITTTHSGKRPDEKLEIVRQLSAQQKVTMVGDGINDSPALAAASIGVSMSTASKAAIQSAQVVLLDGDLEKLKRAHQLSKMTLATIKQNLFWAFFYNVIAIPIAAAGLLNPMIAALSMAFSDVVVIGNSLRLRTRKIR